MSRLQDGRPAPPGAVRTRGLGRPLPARGRDASEHVLPPRRTLQARPRGPPGRCRPPADPSQGESLGAPRKGEDVKQGRAGRGPGRRRCAGCGPGGRQHRPGHCGAGRPRGRVAFPRWTPRSRGRARGRHCRVPGAAGPGAGGPRAAPPLVACLRNVAAVWGTRAAGPHALVWHGRQRCLRVCTWTAGPSGTAPRGRWGPANGPVSAAPALAMGL